MTLSGAAIPCCVSERFTALCSLTVLRSRYKSKYLRDAYVSKTCSSWLLQSGQGWPFCWRKVCKPGSAYSDEVRIALSLLLPTCLSVEGEEDSPTQHVKGGTKFLTDAKVEWKASFCDMCDCCMRTSESACLSAAATAVQWWSKPFPCLPDLAGRWWKRCTWGSRYLGWMTDGVLDNTRGRYSEITRKKIICGTGREEGTYPEMKTRGGILLEDRERDLP